MKKTLKHSMKKYLNTIVVACTATIISLSSYAETERHIHVNGEHLQASDIALMDKLFQGEVTDGNYWVNETTGEWGYENSPYTQGTLQAVVAYNQGQSQAQEQSSTYQPNAEINMSQNGSVVSGRVNGQNCTYASVQGMTMRSCD